MREIVECVPNFSEGRDRAVIDAIAEAIRGTDGCTLLDLDAYAHHNLCDPRVASLASRLR